MKLLASHHSMSYLPFRWKVLNRFCSFKKCQENNIYCQFHRGVRVFDIHVRMIQENPVICHGIADFKGNVLWNAFDTLQALQRRKNEDIYVQLVNEDTFHSSSESDFMNFAIFITNRFNFKFRIVSSKKSWKIKIDEFPKEEDNICFSTRKYNEENLSRYDKANSGIWWFDFI